MAEGRRRSNRGPIPRSIASWNPVACNNGRIEAKPNESFSQQWGALLQHLQVHMLEYVLHGPFSHRRRRRCGRHASVVFCPAQAPLLSTIMVGLGFAPPLPMLLPAPIRSAFYIPRPSLQPLRLSRIWFTGSAMSLNHRRRSGLPPACCVQCRGRLSTLWHAPQTVANRWQTAWRTS